MKQFLFSFLLFIAACTNESSSNLNPPSDSVLVNHFQEKYTAGNQDDGAEFITVDTLYILSKEPFSNGGWKVKYHVKVRYNSPAMGPGFERAERPGFEVDSVEIISNDLK